MTIRTTRTCLLALGTTALLLTAGCSDDTTTTDSGTIDARTDVVRTDSGPGTDGPISDSPVSDAPPADLGSGDAPTAVPCDPAKVSCESLPSTCAIGEVHMIENTCWGKCVPIEQCSDLPAQPDCNITTGITCKSAVPTCQPGYVPTRKDTCYGPCVPIGTCACTQGGPAEQCPDKTYVCHTSAGRCGILGP
ncbi:MAG: hypothetical protein KAI47_28120 [Deltaproteobacteria bacterium]|nr:hypothetical protein [Deltaproteobacteria bacterium]